MGLRDSGIRSSEQRALVRVRRGFALEATLFLLVMFSVIIFAGLSAVSTIAKTSNADYRASRASYAAEGGADDIMSQLDAAMQDGIVSPDDIASIQTPALQGFELRHQTSTTGVPESRTITSGPYAGLYALNQPIDIRVTARDTAGNQATSVLSVNAQTIPLFQFGVFYENDLEILPGQPMTFTGWVHTNGNLYLTSNDARFESQITTPDSVFWQRKDRSERLNGVRINNSAGSGVLLDFDSRSHAGAAFVQRSQQRFSGRLKTSAHGVRPLKLPLPAGMAPVTLVQPRTGADAPMVQDVKMAWKSDWYVTVNARLFNRPGNDTAGMKAAVCDSMVQVRTAGLQLPSASMCRRIFKPVRNAFYDGREDRQPDVLDIHLDTLRIWADSNPSARSPRILYIEFTNVGAGQYNDYVSVRLRQGQRLPRSSSPLDTGGLTIVTERPMYILGDFNTTVWRPAALMADAVTFLSNPPNPAMRDTAGLSGRCNTASTGWCDVRQAGYEKREARATTVNAAILAGHSPTPCDFMRGCTPPYGGGLENFPRFLEDWGGIVFRYTGSLVSLFENRFSTGLWNNTANVAPHANGGYYDPPTRQWAFDVNFRFPERLPPGTPSVGTVLQTAFRPIY